MQDKKSRQSAFPQNQRSQIALEISLKAHKIVESLSLHKTSYTISESCP